jgi:hypothetical protein
MRTVKLLRLSLGTFVLAGAGIGAFLVACGDDDNSTTLLPDSGTVDSSSPTIDSGNPGDGGGPDSATDTRPNAKVQLVNAATDFGPANASGGLRICYALGTDEASAVMGPLPPLPETVTPGTPFAGVFIGTGGTIPGTGVDLSALVIVPYIMNAQSLFVRGVTKPASGPSTSCADLFSGAVDAGGALVPNVDYWKLPSIPANTLVKNKSLILVLTGCAGNSTAGAACGPGFVTGAPGVGNLKVSIVDIDRLTAIDSDKIGAQFVHASPAGAAAFAPFKPGFTGDPTDAGAFKSIATADAGTVALLEKTDLLQVSGVNVASDSFTINPLVAQLAIPLPEVQQLSYGTTVPEGGAYRNGAAFTFIAVGDPGQSVDGGGGGAVFNTRSFHYIALPNDPVITTFGQ